ncbi:MAG: hypothetical protein KF883_09515 [Thermomicrobiales bacterium]|nr:hypothetical protein [Thermomicrobiales bacterium]
MSKVTLRELKENTPAIVRAVEEESAVYNVTLDGGAVAVLEPQGQRVDPDIHRAFMKRHRNIVDLIDRYWTSEKTSMELLREQRDDNS